MRTAAVIVTFNRVEELRLTINALRSQTFPVSCIVVIDNASTDDTEMVVRTDYPEVVYVDHEQNLGSAGGFAAGMEYVHQQNFDWAWLFNDDSRPSPEALDRCLSAIDHLGDGKIGLLKIGQETKPGMAEVLFWKGVRKPVSVPLSDNPARCDLVTFDGCLISTKVFDAIGYCWPGFFMGIYEFDFCLRAKDAGFTIYTLPNGMIEDEKKGSSGGSPPWRTYYNTRNHLYLALRRRSWSIFRGWIIREMKYLYGIMFSKDHKLLRIRMKLLATLHAITGRMGKTLDPADFAMK